ncbi:MAG: TraR/DksA family transcriptional regulator [Myxococcota bacterium]|nr:TraR/DksA family transcriptional regulator [Myxococcota bacterium]
METSKYRDQLMTHRHQLLARFHDERARADEELANADPEIVETATEQWDAQVLSRLGDADAAALGDIIAALRRIEDGSYGECLTCGNPIPAARLGALPATTMCIECADLAALPVSPRLHAVR